MGGGIGGGVGGAGGYQGGTDYTVGAGGFTNNNTGFNVPSDTDVNDYLNLDNFPASGPGLLLAGGNNDAVSDAGSGFTMPTNSTLGSNLDGYGLDSGLNASATVLDGNVSNTYGAFGETVPSSVTDQLTSGSTAVANNNGTYTAIDSDGNLSTFDSNGVAVGGGSDNPYGYTFPIDVTYGGVTYPNVSAGTNTTDSTTGSTTGSNTGIAGLDTTGGTGSTSVDTSNATTLGGLYGTGTSNNLSTTSPLLGSGSTASPSDLIQTNVGIIGTGNYNTPVTYVDLNGNIVTTPATTTPATTTNTNNITTANNTTANNTTSSTTNTDATSSTDNTGITSLVGNTTPATVSGNSAGLTYALNNQGADAYYDAIRTFLAGSPTQQQIDDAYKIVIEHKIPPKKSNVITQTEMQHLPE
jgi:hypothetical protein